MKIVHLLQERVNSWCNAYGRFDKIVDGFIENLNTCKYFVVITSKREEISEFIIKTLHHGATITSATGEFTGEEKTMIHTVCKRFEAIKLRNRIKEIDPHLLL